MTHQTIHMGKGGAWKEGDNCMMLLTGSLENRCVHFAERRQPLPVE